MGMRVLVLLHNTISLNILRLEWCVTMDSTELLETMKVVESEIILVRGDHLNIIQDRSYESHNYHRLHVVDMLHRNKVDSSIYASKIVFKGSSPSPISESCEELLHEDVSL